MKNIDESQNLKSKLIFVGRCAKVVKGGRRFSFAALVVVGDGKGQVGLGLGKASEVMDAKEKATQAAKKNIIRVPLRDGRTIHHDIIGRFGAGKVIIRSAPPGTGIIAGGPIRSVIELLGVKDIVAKSLGSNNPHNMIKAAIEALKSTKSPKLIAEKRGKRINEIVSRRERVVGENPIKEDK